MAKLRFRSSGATLLVVGLLSACNAPDGDERIAHAGAERGDLAAVQPLRRVSDRLVASAVAIGDLDGDGRNDVAMTTSYNFDDANDYMLTCSFKRPMAR